jgi:transcriptional regulator with XRE-family HTH domain
VITFVNIISFAMKERILEFLQKENKTSAQFAEEIGVQPSGISHIISGRNNPSLDFVIRMLEKYTWLSTDWLLFGKGSMYRDQQYATLFDMPLTDGSSSAEPDTTQKAPVGKTDSESPVPDEITGGLAIGEKMPEIERIVMFYSDNTFGEYTRRK